MVVSSLSNIAVPALIGTVLDITTSKGAVVSPSSSATAVNNGGGKSWSIFTSFRNLLGGKFAFRLNNSTSISPNASQATTRSREIEGKDIGRIWLVMIGVFFVGGTASFLRTHCLKMAKESTVRRLRKKILVQMLDCDQSTIDKLFTAPKQELSIEDKQKDTQSKNEKLEENQVDGESKSEIDEKCLHSDDTSESETALQLKNIRGVISILNEDVEIASEMFTTKLADFLRYCNSTINGSIFLISLSPSLCLVSLSLVPLVGITLMLQSKATKRIENALKDAENDCSSFAMEKLSHLKTVKSFGQEEKEIQIYSNLLQKTSKLSTKISLRKGAFMGGLFFTSTSAIMAVVYFGGHLAGTGKLTVGDLISFGAYTGLVGLGSSGISGYLSDMLKGKGGMAVTRVHRLQYPDETTLVGAEDYNKGSYDIEKKRLHSDISTSTLNTRVSMARGEKQRIAIESLDFHNLRFRYPNRSETINYPQITITKGDIVAIVGPSGRGKSTLGSLLLGLYEPSSGTITLNKGTSSELNFKFGENYKENNIQTGADRNISYPSNDLNSFYKMIRKEIGLVEQEPVLFSGTIAENIAYSDDTIIESKDTDLTATRKRIEESAKVANAHEFISRLPLGYDTYLGVTDSKCELSGGQKQRIAIARAVFKDPSIFFFDEATSSLDAENAREVNEALLQIIRRKDKTVIIISHNNENPLIEKAKKIFL